MMKQIFAVAALLAFAAAPLALAHEPPGPNTGCHPTQNPHDYQTPGGAKGHVGSMRTQESQDLTNAPPWPSSHDPAEDHKTSKWAYKSPSYAAYYEAYDGNTEYCPGDAIPGDFDGDYEDGRGGGFFPAGVWADDPTCDYGLTAHHDSGVFTAVSSIPAGADVSFTVGADPTPPTLVPSSDPDDDDGFDCVTDGSVTPDVDTDDWSDDCVNTCTAAGAPSGDGGYSVWVNCVAQTLGDELVDFDTDPPTVVGTPPTGVQADCSLAGHVGTL